MSTVGFWREIRQDSRDINIQSNRLGKMGRPWYLFPQGGGPRGSFSLWSDLSPNLRTRDIVIIGGVVREQITLPEFVHDVEVFGAVNRPYQATDSGSPNQNTGAGAAGATWLAPTSPTAATPLIQIPTNTVGWKFSGIMFGPPTDAAAIKVVNNGGLGSGHHVFENLYFSGGFIGIEDNGGMGFVLVNRCRFRGHTGAGGGGIVCTSTSNAVPLQNEFLHCDFFDNVNNFIASQQNSKIKKCTFDRATTNVISTVFNSGQGGGNHVVQNDFNIVADEFDPSGSTGAVTGAADDVWYNYLLDTVESGQPA
jgi:hypothetical protein